MVEHRDQVQQPKSSRDRQADTRRGHDHLPPEAAIGRVGACRQEKETAESEEIRSKDDRIWTAPHGQRKQHRFRS
jgi:hypothetical protein